MIWSSGICWGQSENSNSKTHLREVSVLGGRNCILGDVVPEDHTRVGAVHHPQSVIQDFLDITLALQLPGQTLPVLTTARRIGQAPLWLTATGRATNGPFLSDDSCWQRSNQPLVYPSLSTLCPLFPILTTKPVCFSSCPYLFSLSPWFEAPLYPKTTLRNTLSSIPLITNNYS